MPALYLLKLLRGQHHPTVRLVVLREEDKPGCGPRLRPSCRAATPSQDSAARPCGAADLTPVPGTRSRKQGVHSSQGEGHTLLPRRQTLRSGAVSGAWTPHTGGLHGGQAYAQCAKSRSRGRIRDRTHNPAARSSKNGHCEAASDLGGFVTLSLWLGVVFILNHTAGKLRSFQSPPASSSGPEGRNPGP